MKTLFSMLLILLWPALALAAPGISTTSGTWVHKGSITISSNATNFGTKSPAAPKVWDACDEASASNLDTHWPGNRFPYHCEDENGVPSETPYEMGYRTSFHGFSTMPHSNITKFICAAHIKCVGADDGKEWASVYANNVITTAYDWDTNYMYISYWYRVSDTFSAEDAPVGGPNMKELSANCHDDGEPYTGNECTYLHKTAEGSDAYVLSCSEAYVSYPDDLSWPGMPDGCAHPQAFTNPMTKWVHMEHHWTTEAIYYGFCEGSRSGGGWCENTVEEPSNIRKINNCGTTPCSISVGGYNRWPRVSTTGNYRYWAGLYLDDTCSRVVLGNNATWTNCTIREPQIPSAWSTSSIAATVNQGALPNGTAYLFVFDSNNDVNPVGYEITLSSSGSSSATFEGTTPVGCTFP